MSDWWVYMIEKQSKYYVGITTDMTDRLRQHGQSDELYSVGPLSQTDAVEREKEFKGMEQEEEGRTDCQSLRCERVSQP